MKKNYFNLTKKERKDYYKEFKKTPIGFEVSIISRAINGVLYMFGVVTIALLVALAFFGKEDIEFGYTIINISVNGLILYLLVLFLYLFNKFYVEYNFSKWLKLTHKIEK